MALAAGQTGHLSDHEEAVYTVVHGGTAGTARPTLGSAGTQPTVVKWIGSVEPTNAVNNDEWWDTTNSLVKHKVSGSFVTFGRPLQPPRTSAAAPDRDSNLGGADRAAYFRVRDAGTISKIRVRIGTSSGDIAVAVYDNTGTGSAATPNTRKATSGVVACPAAGSAEIALGSSVSVSGGDWFCIWLDNTTATFGLHGNSATIFTGASGPAQLQGSLASGPPSTASASHHIYWVASMTGIT